MQPHCLGRGPMSTVRRRCRGTVRYRCRRTALRRAAPRRRVPALRSARLFFLLCRRLNTTGAGYVFHGPYQAKTVVLVYVLSVVSAGTTRVVRYGTSPTAGAVPLHGKWHGTVDMSSRPNAKHHVFNVGLRCSMLF